MLTETFVAATANPERPTNNTAAGIHFHELQPLPGLKSTFKKSTVKANCLAIGETHVFAAQADKAVLHVYNRERKNQEVVVPFPERIHSLALAGEKDGAGVLVLGTEGGRLILWELGTGRQVSTSHHHLQAVTCLAVDRTSNYGLSGSPDTTVHLWSYPNLLSFSHPANEYDRDLPLSPVRTLSAHRGAVTSVAFGHSTSKHNIALSTSKDATLVVWDYLTGDALHTYLLQAIPLCLALDPVDRAAYIGYEDGSIHLIDFFKQSSTSQVLAESSKQSAPSQPPTSDKWAVSKHLSSPIHCLQVSYDGTALLSGHQDGRVHTWDVARGSYRQQVADFAAPVTNLAMLAPTGFHQIKRPPLKLHHVVKPRFENFATGSNASGGLPNSYAFTAQLTTNIPLLDSQDDKQFHSALFHASFPSSLLDETLADIVSRRSDANDCESTALADLRAQNSTLLTQLEKVNVRIRESDREFWKRKRDDEIKAARKKKRRLQQIKIDEVKRKKEMGEPVEEDVEMAEQEDEQDLSSDTDEITESD